MLGGNSLYTKETEFKQFLSKKPSLDEVLSHAQIQEEVLAGTCDLCKLVDRDWLKQLVHYALDEPSPGKENFPMAAVEFFSAKFTPLVELLLGDHTMMREFFGFLHGRSVHNSALAGYFARIFSVLYENSPDAVLEFVFQGEFHIEMVGLLGNDTISRVLYECLRAKDCEKSHIRARIEIVEMLIEELGNKRNSKTVLASLLEESWEVRDFEDLLQYLLLDVNVERVLGKVRQFPLDVSEVLGCLLAKAQPGHFRDQLDAAVLGQLPQLKQILLQDREFLGMDRLAVIRMTKDFIAASESLARAVQEEQLLTVVTSLFFKFEWNSILQGTYCELVNAVLDTPLYKHLLTDCLLIEQLIHAASSLSTTVGNKLFRKGVLAYVFKIANGILRASLYIEGIAEALDNVPAWGPFSRQLRRQSQLEDKILGSPISLSSDSEESSEDSPLPSPPAKFFSNTYWNIQPRTTELDHCSYI